jgi:hypothetical protein
MGEGKSSVIVPLVASTLAEGSNLVRVVTLKPLSNQMFQILVSRLSGLANRPIFYLPFLGVSALVPLLLRLSAAFTGDVSMQVVFWLFNLSTYCLKNSCASIFSFLPTELARQRR